MSLNLISVFLCFTVQIHIEVQPEMMGLLQDPVLIVVRMHGLVKAV